MKDTIVFEAGTGTTSNYLKKLWHYRYLISTFAIREMKIKYAQTVMGVFWVLFQPIPTVIIFTFFFGKLFKVDTGAIPYPVFALVGMIGWGYFTNLSMGIGNSLIDSQHILKKIYFPKLVLPFSKVLSAGVDFAIAFAVVAVALLFFRIIPSWTIVFLPLFLLMNILTGFTIGIWISALTFRFRDAQHIAPYLINFSIWLTPVFYPVTILPQSISYLMFANPMAFVIEGYRFCLSGEKAPDPHYLISVIPVLLLLVVGLWYFRSIEEEITDFI